MKLIRGISGIRGIINDTLKFGKIEVNPKFEGKQIIMIIQPL